MNTASLELCKELYELSGWNQTGYWWRLHKPNGLSKLYTTAEMDHDNYQFRADTEPNRRFREENEFFPAYTLGYLLRKLPYKIGNGNSSIWFRLGKEIRSYSVGYIGSDLVFSYDFNADTPEDAVCKLAIELFKQGVLKK